VLIAEQAERIEALEAEVDRLRESLRKASGLAA
jgi:HAMP domain-containing protein